MDKKIKIAFIYKKNFEVLNGRYWSLAEYHFFIHALKRNSKINVTYFGTEEIFDISKHKNIFDIVLLCANEKIATPDIIGIQELKIPVICGTGDHHANIPIENYHKKWKINAYFNWANKESFYKYYPKNYSYHQIFFGLEPSLFKNVNPFQSRIKNKILNSGAVGNLKLVSRIINSIKSRHTGLKYYKLRTLCNKLSFVDYTSTLNHDYVGDQYTILLQKYCASIAASTLIPVVKYFEIPASGCLTFIEITDKNFCKNLGFEDYKTAIFINEGNYKDKFNEYLSDINNPKWEIIAKNGREFAMKNFNNDKGVDELVNLMENLIENKIF